MGWDGMGWERREVSDLSHLDTDLKYLLILARQYVRYQESYLLLIGRLSAGNFANP